jgi:competence protein ComEC
MKLENYPIVKVLLPYIIGVVVAYYGDFSGEVCRRILISTLSIFLLVCILSFVKLYQWRVVQTVAMAISFVLTGFCLTNMRFQPSSSENCFETSADWVMRVVSEPTFREKSVKIEVEVFQNIDCKNVRGKVLLYVQSSALEEELRYGDLLFVHAKLSRILPPCNPDAFDNQLYMRRRGIYYSGFVREGAWERFGSAPANLLKSAAQKTRNRLTDIYVTAGMSGDELDILKAILLGDDDTLDPELKASYASAGVSHILCVSGMHVGIIYMIINFLLKPLDLFRTSRIIKTILVMLVIWLYASITGLAPSVTRSATMFTFVAVGQSLRRNTNVFHSLFASMFILLVINPLLLFEVGFQLSYLAVAGIVLFQPKLAAFYQCRTRVGKYFWELLTVSVAAQLGTSPISIYYFAQFPNYFMLSNLSVITLSFVVIVTGVALLPVSLIPVVTKYLSWILTWEIRIMNRIIVFIEQLPHSVTEDIDYNILQVLLFYGVIVCFCLLLYQRSRRFFWSTSVLLALFFVSFVVKKGVWNRETEVMVYHIRGCSAVSFHCRGQTVLFADSIQDVADKRYRYNIKSHARKHSHCGPVVPIDTAAFDTPFLCKRGNIIRFCDKTYYLLTEKQRIMGGGKDKTLVVDCLLLRQNPRQPPDEVMAVLPFLKVVADGSNTPFYIERWRAFCVGKGIPFTFTGDRNMSGGG